MVCVPTRGVPLVGDVVPRRHGSLRSACPRSCRLVLPSGLSDLPGRLVRVSPSPAVPSVAAHSADRGSSARGCRVSCLGIHSWPLFRAFRSGSARFLFGPGSFLMDLQNTCLPLTMPGSQPCILCLASGMLCTRSDRSLETRAGPMPCPALACGACPTALVFPLRGQPVSTTGPCATGSPRRRGPRVHGELPSDVLRKVDEDLSRGCASIGVSGSGLAASAGFSSQWLA